MKTTTFLLLLFFSSFAAFSQSIELHQPSKRLCIGSENELIFSIRGDFPSDEKFNLYGLTYSGDTVLLVSSDKSPIKFIPEYNFFPELMIEGSKSKTYSNILNVEYNWLYFNISYGSTKACTGYSVPLKIDSVNYKFDKIQWLKNNVPIPDANQYTYNATESGSYYVKVERDGCVSIDSVRRHVNVKIGEIDSPYINTESSIMNICDGYSVRFDARQNNLKDARYQWLLNGNPIPDANKNFYLAKKQGIYSLKISQGTCEAKSGSSKVIVGDLLPPQVSIYPYSRGPNNIVEICDGTELNFISRTYLNYDWNNPQIMDGIKFQWQKDDVDIPMATNYAFKTKDAGRYRLKVSQGDCIVFSELIIVKIGTPKVISLESHFKEFCAKDNNITAYVRWDERIDNNSLYCKIYRDGKFFVESQNYSYFKIQESGKYNAVFNFNVPGSTKTCTVYSDTVSIAFKDKLVNYKMTDISSTSSCLDSLLIRGEDWVGNKQWKFNGISIPGANDNTIMAKQSGAYQLETQTNSGCIYQSEPVNIAFNKLDIRISKYFPVCYDSLQTLSAIINSVYYFYGNNYDFVSKPISYEWQLDGKVIGNAFNQFVSKPGNYSLTMKQGACIATTSLLIDNNAFASSIPKTLTPNQDSLVVCINTYATVSAPKGDFTYIWLKDNQPFENNKTQTIKVAAVGSYKVWIEGGGCARMSNSIALKENKSLVTATISGNKELMSGDSTRIKIDLTSLPPWTIK